MPDSQLLTDGPPHGSPPVEDANLKTVRLNDRRPGDTLTRDTQQRPDAIELVSGSPLPVDDGRYELLAEIGRGGMGAVYRGVDRELKRELAVKVLLDQHLLDPDQVRRFHKEAWVIGQLQHPGIVPLYDVGRLATGRPFFVMKLVDGRNLASHLNGRRDSADDRPRLLKVFEQICQTIAYAHSRGVIHRDLKPSNIMVGEFGEVQVMDWGLARVLANPEREPKAELTPSGRRPLANNPLTDSTLCGDVIGTPAYMAPEQARGSIDLDERTDVFGLGAILCEILTGKPPYTATDAAEALNLAIRGSQDETIARLKASGAEPELVELAERCLDAEMAKRPANAGEVSQSINAYLSSVEQRVRDAELESAAAMTRVREERKRRRLAVALGLAVFAIVGLTFVGGIVVAYQRVRRTEDRAAFEQQRAARNAETIHRIDRALNEAEGLSALAREQRDSLPSWTRALAAARQAEQLLTDELNDSQTSRRIAEALRNLERAEAAARRDAADRRMIAQLEDVRLKQTALKNERFDMWAAVPAFTAAFREYGIDVETLAPAEASRLIVDRSIRSDLAVALVGWAIVRRNALGKSDPLFMRLLDIAQLSDPDKWNQSFRAALRTGDGAEVRSLAASVDLERVPPSFLYLLIGELAESPERTKAVELSRRAVRRYPSDFWLNHQCGFLLLDSKPPRLEEGIRYLTATVAIRPQSPGARVNLGVALQQNGQFREAVDETREALRLQPDYTDAYNNLGLNLVRLREYPEAIAALRRAMELRPDQLRARTNLSDALIQAGRFQEALEVCRDLLKMDAKNKHACVDTARAYCGLGKWTEAEAASRRVVELHPNESVAHYNLANMLSDRNRDEEAIVEFRRSIELGPEHAESYCNMAHAMKKLGRFAEAHETMKLGHEIGSKSRTWPYPSADWVKETASFAEQERRLAQLRAGSLKSNDAADLFKLAEFAVLRKRQPAVALELFDAAFRTRPEIEASDPSAQRATATVAVAMAVAQGDAATRDRWLPRAIGWLKADLSWFKKEADGANRGAVVSGLKFALGRPEWLPLRDPDQLAKLPELERIALTKHWDDVRALYKRIAK